MSSTGQAARPKLSARATPAQREAVLKSDQARAALDAWQIADGLRSLRKERQRLEALCCSRTWVDDCWHGATYAPTVPCRCRNCKGRRKFPRQYVHHGIAYECRMEMREPDEELREELERLMTGSPGSVVDVYDLRKNCY